MLVMSGKSNTSFHENIYLLRSQPFYSISVAIVFFVSKLFDRQYYFSYFLSQINHFPNLFNKNDIRKWAFTLGKILLCESLSKRYFLSYHTMNRFYNPMSSSQTLTDLFVICLLKGRFLSPLWTTTCLALWPVSVTLFLLLQSFVPPILGIRQHGIPRALFTFSAASVKCTFHPMFLSIWMSILLELLDRHLY